MVYKKESKKMKAEACFKVRISRWTFDGCQELNGEEEEE